MTKSHADAVTSHTEKLALLKEQHAAAVAASANKDSAHKSEIETLKATHAKNLDEAHDKAITSAHVTRDAELKQLQGNHATAIAALKKEHTASQQATSSDTEKLKVNLHLWLINKR